MEIIGWFAAAYFATGICFGIALLRAVGWGGSVRSKLEGLLVAVVAWPAILIAAKFSRADD
jgi:hypothetical protein